MIDGGFVDAATAVELATEREPVFARWAGDGPPLLLLHGFPETHRMWDAIAGRLTDRFTVVCADLPGYGRSGDPADVPGHAGHSKRAFAADLAAAMSSLGHERFAVAGHDRGARVGYRLALDHPERVTRLAVLDVVPIDAAWEHADDRLALGFWPWSLLAQDAPLPERLLGAAPEAVIEQALGPGWGSAPEAFDTDARADYLAQLRDPARLHSICEEYRAAATVDRDHDRADCESGRVIECPVLALWSEAGPVGTWYAEFGGPLALWRGLAPGVTGEGVAGGHFFAEEHPEATAAALAAFLRG